MKIRKSFKFRLYPTKNQARALESMLEECRWLYNHLLEQRILAYEELEMTLTKYQQLMFLPALKKERPSLEGVHSQVLQNVIDRLDKSFQGFFRRCKTGDKPGFPRFRGAHRYQSFCYPQTGFAVIGKELKLSKIGSIRIKMHRPIEGEIKTCTLRKTASGAWEVSLSCVLEGKMLPQESKIVGVDVGIENFAVLSTTEIISNPRFLKKGEKALVKTQKKFSKAAKGTLERRKQGKVLTKIHERIRNQRKDFCHKESRKLVNHYQSIYLEDLEIKKMMEGSPLAKSIADASWNQFCEFLTYKAEEAGRDIRFVNPAYTTQTCAQCKSVKEKKLSERMHICAICGYTASRDYNAAQNILALGIDGLGRPPRSLRL